MKIKIPSNLDFNALILQNEDLLKIYNYKNCPLLWDKMAYICYSIHCSAASHRDWMEEYHENNIQERPFYPLCASVLHRVLHDYNKIAHLLIQLGVIQRNESYIVGEKSKGFRFCDKYYGVHYKPYQIKSFVIARNLNNAYKKRKQTRTSCEFLRQYWANKKLTIDVSEAMNWIKKNEIKELNEYRTPFFINETPTIKLLLELNEHNEVKNIREKHELYRTSVEKLCGYKPDNFLFHNDGCGQRLYTMLCGMKKELRNFVTYNGEELVSIDLKNSQPYLSLALFDPSFWNFEKNEFLKKIKRRKKEEFNSITKSKLSTIIMFLKNSENQYSKGFQKDTFSKLVSNGTIYEALMEKFKDKYPEVFCNRDLVKQEYMRFMFYDQEKRNIPFYQMTREIEQIYPFATELFDLIKEGNYKILPIILQSLERHLIIDVICKKINSINPNIPLFTIHDCIVTTAKHVDFVSQTMQEELQRAIGIKPQIALENWVFIKNYSEKAA